MGRFVEFLRAACDPVMGWAQRISLFVTMSSSSTPTPQPLLTRCLLIAAALYVLVWSLLPPLLSQSLPLDVVESLSWGREWQWGTYKHPTLGPSVLHVFYMAFGKVGPFLLSQLCIVATLWMVWLTGCRLMSRERAFLGTVLTMGVAYYGWPAIEFNHNIAQMPTWAALGYLYVAALQDGRLHQWLLLGLMAGLGMLTKYSIGIILACMGLYILLSAYRKVLLGPGPWLALVVLCVVMAPHLYWLKTSEWLPFAYAGERAATASDSPRLAALGFLLTQFLNHLPLLCIAGFAALKARKQCQKEGLAASPWHLHTQHPALLLVLALGPGLLVTVLGVTLGMRLRDMWGTTMWAFSGLVVAACVPTAWLGVMRPRVVRGVGVWLVLLTIFAGIYLTYGAQLRKRPARMDWPAVALAQQAQQTWSQVSSCRLDVVAGDYWLSGLVATAIGSHGPSVLITGDARYSPWVTPQRLQQHGALWLRQEKDMDVYTSPPQPLEAVAQSTDFTVIDGTWNIAWAYDSKAQPLTVRWRAYVPASCVK